MSAPLVTILIPAFDEARDLDGCLDAVAAQDHPHEALEVLVVVDGRTSDETASIAEARLAQSDYAFHTVVHHDASGTPHNLNAGLAVARGTFVCRVDARSRIPSDYVRRCTEVLSRRPEVAVVGGAQVALVARPDAVGAGIARALNNRWGMGWSRYRRNAPSGVADTVYLGAFRTDMLRLAGGWDPALPTNQDFDLNRRMSTLGIVWYESGLPVGYIPRSSVAALYRQYVRFGRGKVRYWRHSGDSPRARQLVLLVGAPLGVATAVVAFALLPAPGRLALVALVAGAAAVVETVGSRRPRGSAVVHGWAAVALGVVGIGWLRGAWGELLAGWSGTGA
jgi:glycosyltransferase involved in cell wall biosynthesis